MKTLFCFCSLTFIFVLLVRVESFRKKNETALIPSFILLLLSQYERFFCIGDFNSEITGFAMKNFCDIYHLKNLVSVPTCYKNPLKPSCIDIFLTNCSRSFQDTQVIETGLSHLHKMNITVLKMFFSKQKHETVFFQNYRKFDNSAFREALNR